MNPHQKPRVLDVASGGDHAAPGVILNDGRARTLTSTAVFKNPVSHRKGGPNPVPGCLNWHNGWTSSSGPHAAPDPPSTRLRDLAGEDLSATRQSKRRAATAPPTTAGTHITLTSQQIDEWPESEKEITLSDGWPTGRPIAFSIPPLERGVPICRKLALRWLEDEQIEDEDARYTVLLVMSELISNAIQHSCSSHIISRLWKRDGALFVEVCDEGGTTSVPRVTRSDVEEVRGRGLKLVAEAAGGWGRRLGSDGTCAVWAAVPLAART